MKRFIAIFATGVLLLVLHSCTNENTSPTKGYVTFSLSQNSILGGRTAGDASAAIVSIKDNQGKLIYENHRLSLLTFGQGYISESLELGTGNFTLTAFAILNANDEIIYASPFENSDKAKYVSDPLPITFTISKEATTQLVPEVVNVTSLDTPESFG